MPLLTKDLLKVRASSRTSDVASGKSPMSYRGMYGCLANALGWRARSAIDCRPVPQSGVRQTPLRRKGFRTEMQAGSGQAVTERVGDGGGAIVEVRFREDVREVVGDGFVADAETLANLAVRQTLGDKGEHFNFALRQAIGKVAAAITVDAIQHAFSLISRDHHVE